MAEQGSPYQQPARSKLPIMDGSGDVPPVMSADLNFRDVGSYGLRQFSGYLRDEFLRALQGREAARTYREMGDNSPTVGAILFAVIQLMRRVDWPIEPANDSAEALKEAEFVQSLKDDMSHTWDEFMAEALSMLQYGYSLHEIVYKRRNGPDGETHSKYDDGRIGIKRLPVRGQDTVLKWFFDENGQYTGVRQQPWVGPLIDIPSEKTLLFRPLTHKANPEGRSILRSAYRPYYFVKRMEEQEAIWFERMSGFPVMSIPAALLTAAANGDAAALAAVNNYKKIISNVRIDEQMGLIKPSDPWMDANGQPSSLEQYKFELVTPSGGGSKGNAAMGTTIERYKLDILTSVLADFVQLGHGQRGTQSVAVQKVDMFFQAIEGWTTCIAEVLNRHLLPRLWRLNDLNPDLMPKFIPGMTQRIDLDALGNFMLHLSQAGMAVFPNFDLENYIRAAAGLPEITQEEFDEREAKLEAQQQAADNAASIGTGSGPKAPGQSEVPAGERSSGPQRARAVGVHQPNTNARAGVGGRNQRGKLKKAFNAVWGG